MSTGFRSLHPLPCFLYYVSVVLLSMLLLHPFFLLSSILLLGILNLIYDASKAALGIMLAFFLVGIIFGLINPLFSHRGEHILFYLWDQPITLEAICYGLTIALSTITVLYAFISYRHVIANDKFFYLFSSIWPRGSLITVMALRFIPMLYARLRVITMMQRTKEISMMHGSLQKRAGNGMKLLQILLTWSMEEALQTADSMKARGYGLGPRSTYTVYRMRSRDWFATAFIVVACLSCVLGKIYGYGFLAIYPSLESWSLTAGDWGVFSLFIILVGWPLAMEGKEWLTWRLLK